MHFTFANRALDVDVDVDVASKEKHAELSFKHGVKKGMAALTIGRRL
jgi:hypothetical protein